MAKNFSREVVDALLDKLSSDDQFRDLFKRNPRAALAQLGHHTDKAVEGVRGSDPVMCLQGAELASKEEIRASRDILSERLSGSMFHYDMVV